MKLNPTRYKKTPAPTLGERYGAALALHGAAVSVFNDVLDDMLQAEAELHELAGDAQDEIFSRQLAHDKAVEDLADIREMAKRDADAIAQRANNIRALVA